MFPRRLTTVRLAEKRWPPPTIADVDAATALAPLQAPGRPWSAGALRPAGRITVSTRSPATTRSGCWSVVRYQQRLHRSLLAQRGRGWLGALETIRNGPAWL